MSIPHPTFACKLCGGRIRFERCADYHDTGHPLITAMECAQCGGRHEWSCKACKRERDLDDQAAAMWEAFDAD